MLLRRIVIFFLCCFAFADLFAQADTVITVPASTPKRTTAPKQIPVRDLIKNDSIKPYNPRIAIVRSAMVPGWGQITNKKYWKVPIVYGALGTTAFLFFRNLKQYKEARNAFKLASDTSTANDYLIPEPYYSVRFQPERIRAFRNSVRQNVDYSVLFFILFWGVQVADAAVDAHLKTFDVSDDISLHIKPGYSPMARTSGISLVMNIK